MKPILFGCSGPTLTQEESGFFAETNPFGFILFQRNCETPDQVRQLTRGLRQVVNRNDAPIFIDQEGGRVARLKPPHWPSLAPMRDIGELYEKNPEQGLEAMKFHARTTAKMLTDLGINGNCAPVLDLFIEGASSVIGDRAFSAKPDVIAALGRVAVDTYLENGVFPVIKHLPGHGRVKADPHLTLPTVETERALLEAQDFSPFIALKDAPIGMNSHIVFTALDPDAPVSLSPIVHQEIIRGALGFQGLLFSDDLAMKALSAPGGRIPLPSREGLGEGECGLDEAPKSNLDELALRALWAGADIVLYCPGTLPEMRLIADALPAIGSTSLARWQRAQAAVSNGTQTA